MMDDVMRKALAEVDAETPGSPSLSKESWGPGPWHDEPDRLEFEAHGFSCLITRHAVMGNLCGYVAMPPGHPWHGKHYNDIDASVHGGLTYANACQGPVCHVPKPDEPDDVWWLGFDMAHVYDLIPAAAGGELGEIMKRLRAGDPSTYRDIAYARAECEGLAQQAAAAQP